MELTQALRHVESVITHLENFYLDRPREERDRYLAPLRAYRYYLLERLEKLGGGLDEQRR